MKQPKHKTVRNIVIAVLILVCICMGYFIYQALKPYPLGDSNKLEYISKDDYGCLICDSMPASDYYYATDMTVDQTIAYFKKAVIDQPPRTIDGETDFDLSLSDSRSISIYYYNDKTKVYPPRIKTNKKAIISIPSFHYQNALNAL